jgi:hypothetical protein
MLGRLEEAVSDPSQALVVLPANEYINDQCINDPKSALGAFVQSKFPEKTKELETLIQLALAGKAAAKVTNGVNTINAYGLGTTVYLDRPLNEGHKFLIAAATTDRAAEELRGDISAPDSDRSGRKWGGERTQNGRSYIAAYCRRSWIDMSGLRVACLATGVSGGPKARQSGDGARI